MQQNSKQSAHNDAHLGSPKPFAMHTPTPAHMRSCFSITRPVFGNRQLASIEYGQKQHINAITSSASFISETASKDSHALEITNRAICSETDLHLRLTRDLSVTYAARAAKHDQNWLPSGSTLTTVRGGKRPHP